MNDLHTIFKDITSGKEEKKGKRKNRNKSKEKDNKETNGFIPHLHNERVQAFLDKIIEFVSINLQAKLNRSGSSSLGQISTSEIGRNIKDIIEGKIDETLKFIEKERASDPYVEDIIPEMLKDIYLKIIKNQRAQKVLDELFDMNLFHNFGQISGKISDFDLIMIDRFLKYLTLLNIQRRLSLRKIWE